VLFTESATAYMGGILAVIGASIEEEGAAGFPSDPVSTPLPMAPQPVPVGPAGDVTAEKALEMVPVLSRLRKRRTPSPPAAQPGTIPLMILRVPLYLWYPPSPSQLLARLRKRSRPD
jgi:hypothetical protein